MLAIIFDLFIRNAFNMTTIYQIRTPYSAQTVLIKYYLFIFNLTNIHTTNSNRKKKKPSIL